MQTAAPAAIGHPLSPRRLFAASGVDWVIVGCAALLAYPTANAVFLIAPTQRPDDVASHVSLAAWCVALCTAATVLLTLAAAKAPGRAHDLRRIAGEVGVTGLLVATVDLLVFAVGVPHSAFPVAMSLWVRAILATMDLVFPGPAPVGAGGHGMGTVDAG